LIDAIRPTHEAGRACVGSVLLSGATAVLAIDDLVAQGIISGLGPLQLSVPADISVVGCDNVIATTTYPPLTTVDAHCAQAGLMAVDLLLQSLSQPFVSLGCQTITGELIVRASTSRVPQGAAARARRSKAMATIV
jgi:DNA-binding LacI/PurR family transcriptional regulator